MPIKNTRLKYVLYNKQLMGNRLICNTMMPNAPHSNRQGMDVGRAVQGEDLGNSKYRILSINSSPENEL